MDKIILTPEDMQFLLDAEYKDVEFHLPFEKEIEVILSFSSRIRPPQRAKRTGG